jgi:divalent metal cation (Fe/Co/Zn/Cd) transporter
MRCSVLKIIIALWSGSMAVIASAVDSVLDIASGSVLYITSSLAERRSPYGYPVGRRRYEPLGVIVLSTLMFVAAAEVIISSSGRVATGITDEPIIPHVDIFVVLVLGAWGVRCHDTRHGITWVGM